jgi:hypothetical protein
MSELQRVEASSPVFDEARRILDGWEREEPDAEGVVLILDGLSTITLSLAGHDRKGSDTAGLCFAAAQLALR